MFLTALSLLTRIPVKHKNNICVDRFPGCVVYFFAVGIIVGISMAVTKYTFDFLGFAYLPALACITAECLITGALHIDGFADVCDAFFTNNTKEDCLKIMRDSRLGAYGVLGIFFLFFLKIILINLLSDTNIFKLIAVPVAGKIPIIICAAFGKYPCESGMGVYLIGKLSKKVTVMSLLLCALTVVMIFYITAGLITVIVMFLTSIILIWISELKIGGITGDVLGCANELGEAGALLILALI